MMMTLRWRETAGLLAVVIVGAALALQTHPAGAAPPDGFCAARSVKNYLSPLGQLPPIRQLPHSGKLGFGPKGLNLEPKNGQLVVKSGWIGFVFSDDAVGQARRLKWDLDARLYRVDAGGRTSTALAVKGRKLGTVRGNEIGDVAFFVKGAPALYRTDIRIRDRSGRLLGSYSEYWRLVRPSFDVRLVMPGNTVRRGETVGSRLANFGTEAVSSLNYRFHFSVEFFDGQNWIKAPSDPSHRPMIKRGRGLTAGSSTSCFYFRTSDTEVPGRYRVRATVDRELARRSAVIATEFEITAKALK